MIGADNQLADADFGCQMAQRFVGEHQRVEIHLAHVLGGLFLEFDAGIHFGRDAQAIVRTRRVRAEESAAVRRANFKTGKFIQRAFKDQMRQRDGGVERIADGVGQPAVAAKTLGQLGRALRMDEQQHAEFFGLGPHRMKLRISEFLAGHAAADGRTAHAKFFDRMLQLLHREIGRLQRQRGKTHKAVRMPCAQFRQRFVVDFHHFGGKVALKVIPMRVDADRLDIDALLVHFADADHADFADVRPALVGEFFAHQFQRLGDHAMRMHIDGFNPLATHAHLTAASASRLPGRFIGGAGYVFEAAINKLQFAAVGMIVHFILLS